MIAKAEHDKIAIGLGIETLKSLVLINGGAAIGILTFYGNQTGRIPIDQNKLFWALVSFGVGVGAAVATNGFAFASTFLLGHTADDARHRKIAVGIGAVSLAAFASGIVFAAKSFI